MGELFVPGRLCLFGEHSDWAGGWRAARPELAPGCVPRGGHGPGDSRARRRRRTRSRSRACCASGEEIGPARIEARPAALAAAARGADFFSYAAGVAAEVMERHGRRGLRLRVAARPAACAKGLSSSAADLRARGARLRVGLRARRSPPRDEMELAYAGERRTGSECGRMDQVCAFGRRATCLRFDGDGFEVEPLAPAAPLHLLIVDLRRGKDTRRILADLNACFPDAPGAVAAGVREALGADERALLARARRAVQRRRRARPRRADARGAGALRRAVAPASPAELAAPRLHAVLAHPALRELACGGKGVGSQGDGCAQLVARGPEERARLAARLERDLDVRCWPLTPGGADGSRRRSGARPARGRGRRCASSSSWVPSCDDARRCSSTTIWSAWRTVERRCAITNVVRPASRPSIASCTRRSLFASSELVASSKTRIAGSRSDRARDRDALALAAREPHAGVADVGVVALRQPVDELVHVRGARRLAQLGLGGARARRSGCCRGSCRRRGRAPGSRPPRARAASRARSGAGPRRRSRSRPRRGRRSAAAGRRASSCRRRCARRSRPSRPRFTSSETSRSTGSRP